jgi:macrodomain Ter protein organizer (MatP/YcbG family)
MAKRKRTKRNIINTEPVKKFIKHTHPVDINIIHTEPVKKYIKHTHPVDINNTKGLIRNRKDRHYNGQTKKDKKTNNDLRNTTQKTKDSSFLLRVACDLKES